MNIQNEIEDFQRRFERSCELLTTGEKGSEKRFKEESLLADGFIIAADRALQMVTLPDEERLEILVRKVAVELYYAERLNERVEKLSDKSIGNPENMADEYREKHGDLVEMNIKTVDPDEADLGKNANPHNNT